MLNFIGTYECKMDAKGRFLLPAGLKKQLQSVMGDGLVLKRSVFHQCLELYPMEEWNRIMKQVNGLNRFVKKNNDFIRAFTAGVKVMEVDGAGRLLVAKDLLDYAKLSKGLVLSSAGPIIEIWDKAKYEQVIQSAEADFPALAEEVMGGMSIGDEDE